MLNNKVSRVSFCLFVVIYDKVVSISERIIEILTVKSII